jgi:hypothetical protein
MTLEQAQYLIGFIGDGRHLANHIFVVDDIEQIADGRWVSREIAYEKMREILKALEDEQTQSE